MALEQLLEAIEHDAREEIEAVLARARREASAIALEESERAAAERGTALAREEARLRSELAGELASVRLLGRRQVCQARQRLIDRVLEVMRARLEELLQNDRYLGSLPSQLDACFDYVGDTHVVVRTTPSLAPRLRELVAERGSVSIEREPSLTTGFRLVAPEENLTIDATLERALEHHRREIEIALFRTLKGAT